MILFNVHSLPLLMPLPIKKNYKIKKSNLLSFMKSFSNKTPILFKFPSFPPKDPLLMILYQTQTNKRKINRQDDFNSLTMYSLIF